ncbi:hypothetical protein [Rhizobium laguerreae]|uniref:hypothetical protein n=1 Tax=Rhizobium laguerreae TaxID=1076926 RepID=UPI001C91A565|nr:hypothetical protein [Rhizobium laguerreae]MBY3356107.1 hypothetical protein [Rhizobium laguerreae]MBY3455034.1 hypothetical protein [Rhizobium laguerreae]MBY3462204.1 hypothetical protein [Rhizobium laguerreae]
MQLLICSTVRLLKTLLQGPAPAEAISEDEITSVYCPTDGTYAAFQYWSNSSCYLAGRPDSWSTKLNKTLWRTK